MMATQFPVSYGVVLKSSIQREIYEHLLLVQLKTSSHCLHVIWERHLPLPSFGDTVRMNAAGTALQVGASALSMAVAQFVPRVPSNLWDAALLLMAHVLMRLGRLARRMHRAGLEQHLMNWARAALTMPVQGVLTVSAQQSGSR